MFPIDGVREAYEAVREVYRSLGAEDRIELYVGPNEHRFYKKRVWPFLAQWLRDAV